MIISNGNAVGAMEFYSSIGFIGELAQLLDPTQFQVAQVLERELGSELAEANFAFYLRIRLCRMNEREFSLTARMNNNADHQNGYSSHDVFLTELALVLTAREVEALGIALKQFAELKQMRLLFSNEGCVLDDTDVAKEYMASDNIALAWKSLPMSLFE